jgi:hypothetical protein
MNLPLETWYLSAAYEPIIRRVAIVLSFAGKGCGWGVGYRLRGSHLDQDQISLSSQPPVFPGFLESQCALTLVGSLAYSCDSAR